MKLNSYIIFVMLIGWLLCGCATQPSMVEPSLVAEPLPIKYENEISILRINRLVNSPDLSAEQRAELLYERGMMYEKLGLKSMAKFDYDYAIKLKPDFAAAYGAIGVHMMLSGQFERAYEAFDSAIDLAPEYQFVYLSRGIALYYGGRPQLAIKDIQHFLSFDPNDPYRVIWHYIVQMRFDPLAAARNLAEQSLQMTGSKWAEKVIQLYLGQISEYQLLQTLLDPSLTPTQKAQRQCEAYFYLAKLYEFGSEQDQATTFYKLALATNVYDFIEHKYARFELNNQPVR